MKVNARELKLSCAGIVIGSLLYESIKFLLTPEKPKQHKLFKRPFSSLLEDRMNLRSEVNSLREDFSKFQSKIEDFILEEKISNEEKFGQFRNEVGQQTNELNELTSSIHRALDKIKEISE